MSEAGIIVITQLSGSERRKLKKAMTGYGNRTAAIKATGLDGSTLDKAYKTHHNLDVRSLNAIRLFINHKNSVA